MDLRDREIYRKDKTIYSWRCAKEVKEKLLIQSAKEGRTANKILEDALEIYLYLKNKNISFEDIKKQNSGIV